MSFSFKGLDGKGLLHSEAILSVFIQLKYFGENPALITYLLSIQPQATDGFVAAF